MSLDVAIIDYKISNMFSVNSACEHLGLKSKITSDFDEILNAKSAILPGVGTFGLAMEHLEDLKLIPVIHKFIDTGKPFMGICLGMQLLLTESEEFGLHKGLNIIAGKVRKFPKGVCKIPHIGWNRIISTGLTVDLKDAALLQNMNSSEYMYFVHSYYVEPEDKNVVLTITNYAGINYCSSFVYKNILACQFHPEKSGLKGLKILKNFFEKIKTVNLEV